MTGVFDSLVADMHSTQITASSTFHQPPQPPSGGGAGPGSSLHKPQESPTLPVSTATDSSYYTNQQPPAGGGGGGSPYPSMGSYQYHAGGLGGVPYSAKGGYDLGYTAAYSSYAPYGTSPSPANNEPGEQSAGVRRAQSAWLPPWGLGRWVQMFGAGISPEPGLSHYRLPPGPPRALAIVSLPSAGGRSVPPTVLSGPHRVAWVWRGGWEGRWCMPPGNLMSLPPASFSPLCSCLPLRWRVQLQGSGAAGGPRIAKLRLSIPLPAPAKPHAGLSAGGRAGGNSWAPRLRAVLRIVGRCRERGPRA